MACSKRCTLVSGSASENSDTAYPDWGKCIFCQIDSKEKLQCPARSKRDDVGAGYASLADILPKFDKLNALPSTVQLSR